jgi:hypothetical protein
VFDDFSDLNDTANPAWTHLDGYVGSTGQTWDASTGAYRHTAVNNGAADLGFVGAHVGPSFTDVIVRSKVVSFIHDPVFLEGAVFGIAARLNGMNGVGELNGYGYVYEPGAASGAGEMVLYRINSGIDVDDIGAQRVTLDPEQDYEFVLEVIGDQLHGQVFNMAGEMIAERFATDTTYAAGTSGLFAYSQAEVPNVDVAWDNFSAVPEPGTGLLLLSAGALFLRRRSRAAC